MPFPKIRATRDPQALSDTTAATRYAVQNQGLEELYVTTAENAPVPGTLEQSADAGFLKVPPSTLHHDGIGYVTPATDESIWVWRREHGQDLDVVWFKAAS